MKPKRHPPLHNLRRTALKVFLIALILLGISWKQKSVLPPPEELLPDLSQDPIQAAIFEEDFIFEYLDKEYHVEPVADYELWGLVVTHNNIHSIADMYHDKTSVDIKDLCVVWGDNIESSLYQKLEYSSAPWTCYVEGSRNDYRQFNGSQFSNNHLLADNKNVHDLIKSATIGDQVHLSGMLVNYSPASNPDWKRKSSLVRDDTGNGACEVMYVEQIEILKKANPGWHKVFRISKNITLGLLVLMPLLFLLSVYLDHNRSYRTRP
jgi:hypothetical protein